MQDKTISVRKTIVIYSAFTAYFVFLLFTLYPLLKSSVVWNPALNWFVTGYFLFVPMAVYAVVSARKEGSNSIFSILSALSIRGLSARDWKYSMIGLLLLFVCTGVIFGISYALSMCFGVRELSTAPWFIEMHPLQGAERLLMFIWFPMFCFNIIGEEVLWRGYIQKRLSVKYAWPLCSLLWLMFHFPFGIDLMIMLVPIVVIVPFVFYKTQNTLVGIFIHGVYNGPIFVAVALGAMPS